MLGMLAESTSVSYTVYYGDVKDEMSRLFGKYEEKFGGASRPQRVAMPSTCSGKNKQVWGRIYGGPGASFPPHVHLVHLLLVSSKLTWTVTQSLIGMSHLTYCYGGVTTS